MIKKNLSFGKIKKTLFYFKYKLLKSIRILFFEYMSLNKEQYIELIKKLYDIGHSEWTIINNYGSVIFENRHYKDVLDYVNVKKNDKILIDIYYETNLTMNNH